MSGNISRKIVDLKIMEAKEKNSPLTRMHSSRMRTAGFSTVIGGGGEVVSVTENAMDRQTFVKILPCPKLRLQAVINGILVVNNIQELAAIYCRCKKARVEKYTIKH